MVIRLTTEPLLMTSKRVVLQNSEDLRLSGECSREYGRRGIADIKFILLFRGIGGKEKQTLPPNVFLNQKAVY